MVDTYRNLDFIIKKLAPLGIKNPLLATTWALCGRVHRYRADPANRTQEDHEAVLRLVPFYTENIAELTTILLEHFPELIEGLREACQNSDQQWSRTFQQASAENTNRSSQDQEWAKEYSTLEEAYTNYQEQVNQASRPSPLSSRQAKAAEFEQALARWTLVNGHSPLMQKLEAAKQALEPMIEFESRLRSLKEKYRVPLEGMLAEVNELLVLEPSASHYHYHSDPMDARATSYARLKEQLEFLLEDEQSPLNMSPKWNSVRARGMEDTLRAFDALMTHHFANLSEDMKNIAHRHHLKEPVVVAPAEPEIEMANEIEVNLFRIHGQAFFKKMERSWLQYDRKVELENRFEKLLSNITSPMSADYFSKLKEEYQQTYDSVMVEWNKALNDYYKKINPANQKTLDAMKKKNPSPKMDAELKIFEAGHNSSLNDLGRKETLDETRMIYREKEVFRRLAAMKKAKGRFARHDRCAAEKTFLDQRLNDPVYSKVKVLIGELTTLSQHSTYPTEKRFIHATVLKLLDLANRYELNKNRDPKIEKQLQNEFKQRVIDTIDKRQALLEKLESPTPAKPVRKGLKGLLAKASAAIKRHRHKAPPESHVAPQAEKAFRNFKEQMNPATPAVTNPRKSTR